MQFSIQDYYLTSSLLANEKILLAVEKNPADGASPDVQTFSLASPVFLSVTEEDVPNLSVADENPLDGESFSLRYFSLVPNLASELALDNFSNFLYFSQSPDDTGTPRVYFRSGGLGVLEILTTDPIVSGNVLVPFNSPGSITLPTGAPFATGQVSCIELQVAMSNRRELAFSPLSNVADFVSEVPLEFLVITLYLTEA